MVKPEHTHKSHTDTVSLTTNNMAKSNSGHLCNNLYNVILLMMSREFCFFLKVYGFLQWCLFDILYGPFISLQRCQILYYPSVAVYTLLWFFYVCYMYGWIYDMLCQKWRNNTVKSIHCGHYHSGRSTLSVSVGLGKISTPGLYSLSSHLAARSRDVSKPRDSCLDFSPGLFRSLLNLTGTSAERCLSSFRAIDLYNTQSRGFETSRDVTTRRSSA